MNTQFTVITSVLNAVNLLETTARSIRSQEMRPQWIIADGGSCDGIQEFIHSNSDIVSDFVPGPDEGIYDAWNKALPLIKGQWIVFLGAGDVFADNTVLFNVEKELNSLAASYEIAYGNIYFCAEKTGEILSQDIKPWNQIQGKTHFLLPVLPSHAGVFHNKSLFDRVGGFDKSYKISADTKMQLQALQNGNFHFLNLDIAKVLTGGVSFNADNHHKILLEHLRIANELGVSFSRASYFKDYMNVSTKKALISLFGKNASYRMFDLLRSIRGLDQKWGKS